MRYRVIFCTVLNQIFCCSSCNLKHIKITGTIVSI
jgi:hypothetical protein